LPKARAPLGAAHDQLADPMPAPEQASVVDAEPGGRSVTVTAPAGFFDPEMVTALSA
jgi:hypothetical protein